MTTEPGGEAAELETTKAAPEAAVLSQEPKERDWEAEAEVYGWVPKEQFKGDPDKWRPAEEFVRRGEEILPIVRKQNEKLQAKLSELEETNKNMSRMFEKTIERERQKAAQEIANLKAEKREAISQGDAVRVEQIDAQIDTLKEETQPDAAPSARTIDELTRDFAKVNPWYIEEPDMADYAARVSVSNAALNEDISFEDNMKFVLSAVRKKFPGYFKGNTTAANGHAAVDTGGSFNGGPVGDETYGLNRIELEQAKKDIQAKHYPSLKAWVKAYRS